MRIVPDWQKKNLRCLFVVRLWIGVRKNDCKPTNNRGVKHPK